MRHDIAYTLYDLEAARCWAYVRGARNGWHITFSVRTNVPDTWVELTWGNGRLTTRGFQCTSHEALATMARTLLIFKPKPHLRTRLELLLALAELYHSRPEILPWFRVAWNWSPKPQLRKRNNDGTYDEPE